MNDQYTSNNMIITNNNGSELDQASIKSTKPSFSSSVTNHHHSHGMGKMPSAEPTASPQPLKDLTFQPPASPITSSVASSMVVNEELRNSPPSVIDSSSSSSTPITKRKKNTANGSTGRTKAYNSCHNCKVTHSPLWRKDNEGKTLCNKW
jgi:hypothetical protein